ncbi:hypothetical protein U9M48_023069 [Paspalum notatum var. saurae]|uniref:Uncharacterized protein n=1 Tax=Paspalum notatum var. saurae TaxID=547442 RepID=A0AAQ3TKW7_PASNO
MAPRGGTESPRVGALTITATALLLLILSSLPLSTNAAAAPSPAPAPAPAPAPPARHRPPVPLPGPGNKKQPRGATLGVPPHPGPRHGRPPPVPARPSTTWWRRLNFGERFGIALAGVAVLVQVAIAAFLAVRARQLLLRRAPPGAMGGKAAEERLEAASSPTHAA